MPTCLECFCESGFAGQELQKLVDELHPNFKCENTRCSSFSPGAVNDEECLAFILIDPHHYDQVRNVVVPDAFQELTKRDLSTLRCAFATKSEADDTKNHLESRGSINFEKKRAVSEVCIAVANEIREAADPDGRIFAIYDTALEQTPSHASIFTRPDVFKNRQLRKMARQKIHEIFTRKRVPFHEFLETLKPI